VDPRNSRPKLFILSPFGDEKPQILPFFELQHFVVMPVGSNLTKLNTRAQLQTFPYPTVLKSFLYSDAFMAKSGAQTLTFKSVTEKQTDIKTDKNSTFLAALPASEIEPHQTWHGDRRPRARSCTGLSSARLHHLPTCHLNSKL